ncbi:conserved hypothetical protein [Cupriavidus taiwanensis]|uniref:HAD-IA family hydrolase n=1 Tax=Cupriavidus taiwanensis TaxID=164546 RepID=UPI000E154032|nr:HAD-IA family hydrolase [Cupriavidus taiwanensis]SOZ68305.1 conserved hypothetical protein [Cupriavidus taiwanensis]SOZ84905.1 conserved hypothetical protein [Cupriavidus taiwanensis]SOZ88133.1 conserved hypothetical protein [Cupriavidus taiwanensis]SOZ93772.1 conserved hypothetical protein [Cupriavidus taiwanensis]
MNSNNFKAVVICCDFLMTRPETQRYHHSWFMRLLSRALSSALDCSIGEFICENESGAVARKEFFRRSGIELNVDSTHFYFDPNSITDESVDYLKSNLEGSLIVGYEISEETRNIIARAGLIYVDIWLHPIRFMDDNFFAFKSNSPEINSRLQKSSLDTRVFGLYADKLRIQSVMGWNKFKKSLENKLVDGSCLFVGQTLTDKAVCKRGKMLNVLDFKEEFAGLTKNHRHVYFSRHPLLKGGDEDQLAFLKEFKNVSLVSEPGYKLLCVDAIEKVAAISSSLVYEASYFSKQTEYFYRPIVPVNELEGDGGYFSLYHKLHRPDFWEQLFLGIIQTRKNVPQYDFLRGENTYRDMLSLYYNNHVFDRSQYVYSKLDAGALKKEPAAAKKEGLPVSGLYSNSIALDRIKKQIDGFDVISFDLFDTLVERSVGRPSDVLRIVGEHACAKYGVDADAFVKARQSAKQYSAFQEETPLVDRYEILCRNLLLPVEAKTDLYEKELEVERALLHPRTIGIELVKFARSKGKRVIVVSDTYFNLQFVSEIIENLKISVDCVYVSSDFDETKESGKLYATVKLKENDARILHIGDSLRSDYHSAKKAGISAVWLKSNFDQIKSSILGFKELDGKCSSLRNGVIQRNLAKYPVIANNPGYSQGKAYNLGYNVIGDVLLGYVSWIVDRARVDKVSKIYFLARDGKIAYRIYNVLKKMAPDLVPPAHYLLASRRALRVASLQSEQDVRDEVDVFLSEISKIRHRVDLATHLSSRFGLPATKLAEIGLPIHFEVESGKGMLALREFLASVLFVQGVLENAQRERESYLSYCKEHGLSVDSDDRVAFVDIGHNGTLQSSLAKLLRLQNTIGYYFCTIHENR